VPGTGGAAAGPPPSLFDLSVDSLVADDDTAGLAAALGKANVAAAERAFRSAQSRQKLTLGVTRAFMSCGHQPVEAAAHRVAEKLGHPPLEERHERR